MATSMDSMLLSSFSSLLFRINTLDFSSLTVYVLSQILMVGFSSCRIVDKSKCFAMFLYLLKQKGQSITPYPADASVNSGLPLDSTSNSSGATPVESPAPIFVTLMTAWLIFTVEPSGKVHWNGFSTSRPFLL